MVARPRSTTCIPSSGRKRSNRACERNITARICESPSFNVKYRWPEESWARKFEISPSTQISLYSRSILVRRAATRSRTIQMRRSGALKLKPSWSANAIFRSLSEREPPGETTPHTWGPPLSADRNSAIFYLSRFVGTVALEKSESCVVKWIAAPNWEQAKNNGEQVRPDSRGRLSPHYSALPLFSHRDSLRRID